MLKPGLYQVELSSSSAVLKPKAWVLVCSPEDYKRTAEAFAGVKETTRKWGEQVKPETVSSFLRAALDYLATPRTK